MEKITVMNVSATNALCEILNTYFEGLCGSDEKMLRANAEKASAGGFSKEDRSIPAKMAAYFLSNFAVIYSGIILNEDMRNEFVEAIHTERILDVVDEKSADRLRTEMFGPRDPEKEKECVVIDLSSYNENVYSRIKETIEKSFEKYRIVGADKKTLFTSKLSDEERYEITYCTCNFMYLIRALAKQQSFSDYVHAMVNEMEKLAFKLKTTPGMKLDGIVRKLAKLKKKGSYKDDPFCIELFGEDEDLGDYEDKEGLFDDISVNMDCPDDDVDEDYDFDSNFDFFEDYYPEGYVSPYDNEYTPDFKEDEGPKVTVDLGNPHAIYEYLLSHVYKQDDYCKDAAMILYNHLNGVYSANIVCGPSGSGKTHVWECLKKIYPKIIIVNAATLTRDGWKGSNKVTGFLSQVDPDDPDYIIVFDEFDKCAAPQYSAGGDNVSAAIQSEFLKLIEGEVVPAKNDDSCGIMVDTSAMSFVLCGSFAAKAREIAQKKSSKGFGFETKHNDVSEFAGELMMDDIIEFGVIPELASRVKRLSNVRPLTLEDYIYLITEHEASPIKKMEEIYGIKLCLSKKRCEEIAKKAFESGLGVRNVVTQLQRMFDDRIFEDFKNDDVKPCAS